MRIEQIVNTVFASNTYILSDEGSDVYFLIDTGDMQPVLERIPKSGVISGVFLTHTHYDHIYGINKLTGHYPDCIVYTSADGIAGLSSDKINFSRYHDDPVTFSGENIVPLREGDCIRLFSGIDLNVMETPGHDRSCLTFYTEKEIFTGDSFIPGIKVVATFPRSNRTEAGLSAARIVRLSEGRHLYPGHGDSFPDFRHDLCLCTENNS